MLGPLLDSFAGSPVDPLGPELRRKYATGEQRDALVFRMGEEMRKRDGCVADSVKNRIHIIVDREPDLAQHFDYVY